MIHHTGRNTTAGKTADSRLHFSQTNSRYFGLKPELTASPNPTWKQEKGQNKKEKERRKINQRITYKHRSKKLTGGSRQLDNEKFKCFYGNEIK